MATLDKIKPNKQQRIIDLVREAGIDVSDWSNYKNGEKSPGANPKYCYEWAYVKEGELVVLNLWHDMMREENGKILINLFETTPKENTTRKERRKRLIKAITQAHDFRLPIRVIVIAGDNHKTEVTTDKRNRVDARLLDPVAWGIVSFDKDTGVVILQRDLQSVEYVDQYSISETPVGASGKRHTINSVYNRSPAVRRFVLLRAGGKCEYCGCAGFKLPGGQIYLETHHITPLSEGGEDSVKNVAALCPNHHREAHYGERSPLISQTLRERFS